MELILTELEVASLREHGGNINKIHINEGSKLEKQFLLCEVEIIQDTDSTPHQTFPQSVLRMVLRRVFVIPACI